MENYILKNRLGHGSFGSVWEATRKADGKTVAVKEIYYGTMDSSARKMIVNEVNILRKLKNPHIVRYIDRVVDRPNQKIYIIMEFCPGGDLQSLITKTRANSTYIREEQIWLVLTEMALALQECHCGTDKILHRDIKPGNIFIDSGGHIKLGDFGLARHLVDYARTMVGTPYYMSPELNAGKRYDEKSDIWALGCTIYEMAALRPPFTCMGEGDLKLHIRNDIVPRFSSRYSDSLWKIVSAMLEKNPERRPNVQQILECRNVAMCIKIDNARKELEAIREKTAILKKNYEVLAKRDAELSREKRKGGKVSENVNFN
ncbi:AGC family protein kinase [Histomonas meleagridis]|uniref:AGC family protein kinase n=1 Tax=Histomonas meleagridis TaxID=135588 RepID=UPI00355AC166|nr:AGC family protein kinase [Histomonas meleagridis]KAH0802251.1 AGC family protein kinase [Histomonas meleagridis]